LTYIIVCNRGPVSTPCRDAGRPSQRIRERQGDRNRRVLYAGRQTKGKKVLEDCPENTSSWFELGKEIVEEDVCSCSEGYGYPGCKESRGRRPGKRSVSVRALKGMYQRPRSYEGPNPMQGYIRSREQGLGFPAGRGASYGTLGGAPAIKRICL